MTHVELVDLIAYADPTLDKARRRQVAEHMKACPDCRARFISLNIFKTSAGNLPQRLEDFQLTSDCVPEELMGDYLGDRLSPSEFIRFASHVADCDMCFERASYFTYSTVNMAEGVLNMDSTPERYIDAVAPSRKRARSTRTEQNPSFGKTIWQWISSPAPAYAFAASVLLFMFVLNPGPSSHIVDLDSSQAFSIYESPATSGQSFGFSDAGRKVGEREAGLFVSREANDKLRFSWNAVEGSGEYQFVLHEITPTGPRAIYDTRTSASYVELDQSRISSGKAYRWTVAGSIGSDKLFTSTGQFTLTN